MSRESGAIHAREYAYVARFGGWLWGHQLADHVPPLRSRAITSSADAPPTPPTPPTPPAPPA